jgi:hypothetical protein
MRVSSIRWGVIWIGIGFLFLAINFGVLDKLVFPALFSLWPILLIAIGVELIFRKTRFYIFALLSPLLIAAAFIFAAVYAGGYSWSFSEFWNDWSWNYEGEKHFSEEIALDPSADTLKLKLDLGEAEVHLNMSDEPVFSVNANYYRISPIITTKKEGSTILLNYKNRESRNRSIFSLKTHDIHNEITISDRAWLNMDMETRADYPRLDFSGFKLNKLMLTLRAKESEIGFSHNIGEASIEVNGRSERLVLSIPSDMGLEIRMDDRDIERLRSIDGFYRYAGGLRTDNYENFDHRARVSLDISVRKIDIKRI